MNDVMKFANGPVMWALALAMIAVVVVQAVLIYRLTRRHAADNATMTDEEVKMALKTGGIVSIGPAIAVFVLALSMVNLLGAPATLMRIGIIGSASTEMVAADTGALLAGVKLGKDALTFEAFGTALFACAIMSSGYLIIVPLLSRGLAGPLQRIFAPKAEGSDKKPGKAAVFFGAVFPLLFFAILAATQFLKGMDYVAVMCVAAAVMYLLNAISKKKNIKWLKEWAMGLAVLAAMLCGPVFGALIH